MLLSLQKHSLKSDPTSRIFYCTHFTSFNNQFYSNHILHTFLHTPNTFSNQEFLADCNIFSSYCILFSCNNIQFSCDCKLFSSDCELFSRDCKLFSCNLFFHFIKLSQFNFQHSAFMSDCELFSYDCILFSSDCELFSRDCKCFSCYCLNFNCPTYTYRPLQLDHNLYAKLCAGSHTKCKPICSLSFNGKEFSWLKIHLHFPHPITTRSVKISVL